MTSRAMIDVKVVGLDHHEAPKILAYIQNGLPLSIRREPSNAHDPNAIEVFAEPRDLKARTVPRGTPPIRGYDPYKIGYIARGQAQMLAPVMDAGHILGTTVIETLDPASSMPFSLAVRIRGPIMHLPGAIADGPHAPAAGPRGRRSKDDLIHVWLGGVVRGV